MKVAVLPVVRGQPFQVVSAAQLQQLSHVVIAQYCAAGNDTYGLRLSMLCPKVLFSACWRYWNQLSDSVAENDSSVGLQAWLQHMSAASGGERLPAAGVSPLGMLTNVTLSGVSSASVNALLRAKPCWPKGPNCPN